MKSHNVGGGVRRQLPGLGRLRRRLHLPDAQLRRWGRHRPLRPLGGLLRRRRGRGGRQGRRGRARGPSHLLQVDIKHMKYM